MFADNNKISMRQLKRLLVLDLFSISGMIIPRIAYASAGRDGIVAIVLSTLYAFLFTYIILSFAKIIKGDYMLYVKDKLGNVLAFVIGALYIIKFFACCVFAARLFSEVIKETLLEDTDTRIIILFLIILSAYAASKGFEVRARIAEILYLIILIPFTVFLILGLREVDYTNLFPILTEDTSNVLFSGYEIFLTYSIIEMLLFAIPFIKYRTSDAKHKRKLSSYVGQALCIIGGLNLLFFVVSLGILGPIQTKQTLWSMANMIQVIKLPGGFISRPDAIILGLWMLSISTLISGFLYYITVITKHMFRVPIENYLLIPYILIIFAAASVPMNTDEFYDYFSLYMKFIGIPQSIIIPAFVISIGKLKNFVKKNAAIKNMFLFIIVISAISLTGCSDMTEIEDRNFIQAVGIDYNDNEFQVKYVIPDLKALTGQGTEEPNNLILTFKGENFSRIEEEYHMRYNKRLDFSHLKAIIVGKNLADDGERLRDFIEYIQNKYEISKNTLIYLSSREANDIIKLNEKLEAGIGEYLERLYRINLSNTDKEEVTIGEFVRGMLNENEVIRIPIIENMEDRIETNGLAMFMNYELVYEVDEEEGDYIGLAGGFGKNNRFFFPINNDKMNEYVVRINYLRRKVDFHWVDNVPNVTIFIEGTARIEKGIVLDNDLPTKEMFFANETSTARGDITKQIEEICNEEMRIRIISGLEKIMKGNQIDYLNLYRRTSYLKPSIWLEYEDNMEGFMKDLNYNIMVQFFME